MTKDQLLKMFNGTDSGWRDKVWDKFEKVTRTPYGDDIPYHEDGTMEYKARWPAANLRVNIDGLDKFIAKFINVID